MTDKLELKSCHEVIDTVNVADVDSIFHGKPEDPDILTVVLKSGRRLYCDEVCPIDSLQEEPVSEEFEKALAEEWKGYIDRGAATVDALEDNTQELAFAKGFYRGSKWQKANDESVTQDLGEYINELSKQFPEVSFAKLSRISVRVAKWQKQQDQSTIELAEDHAMLAGMEKMKEQMMKDATETIVAVDAGGYPYIPQIELYDYDKDVPLAKEGDKYKVVLIKEE